MAYENRDYTHLSAAEKQKIESIAQAIRNKAYGIDVRESIALAIEWVNREYKLTIQNNALTRKEFESAKTKVSTLEWDMDEFIKRYSEQLAGNTTLDETIDARVDSTGVSHTTLKDRLDKEHTEVATQLAQTASYATSKFNYLNNAKKEKKVLVSFIADDAPKTDLTKLLPIIQEKNVPVGIGVVTDVVGKTAVWGSNVEGGPVEFMTWEDLKYMELQGAEIMAHTHKHRDSVVLSNQNSDYLHEDLEENKRILSEKGFLVDGFVYPYNSYNQETKEIVKQYFKYSFGRYTSNTPNIDNDSINRYSLGAFYDQPAMAPNGDTSSLEYYKYRVDQAIEKDEWLVFVLHTYNDYFPPIQQQHFKDVIDYIRSKGVEIVSPREGFERYGNIVQAGEFKVAANGKLETMGVLYGGSGATKGLTGLSPITDYTKGKITLNEFGLYDVTPENGFPVTDKYCLMKTYYLKDIYSTFSYQKLEVESSSGRQDVYMRLWKSNAWTEWVLTSENIAVRSASEYDINGLTPITKFPKGRVSYYHVGRYDVSPETGYPVTSVYGILKTTYIELTVPVFANQVLEVGHETGMIKTFLRTWNSDTSKWNSWTEQ